MIANLLACKILHKLPAPNEQAILFKAYEMLRVTDNDLTVGDVDLDYGVAADMAVKD